MTNNTMNVQNVEMDFMEAKKIILIIVEKRHLHPEFAFIIIIKLYVK